ncbi:MAG: peptidyl-prolyl cis-trans isomerase [Acidobacteriota bacterium]|nr:peptidyl-prolyl cis-trans isomerase [Acidobacteriota bacterium]
MTMLDRMRRHKAWLKWSLALVVLTFVVFYIPDFLTTSTGAAPSEVLAEVEGEPITVGTFTRRYNAQLTNYRNAYGGQMNDQLLKQLGIDRQILNQLVDEEAMVAESRKQGIKVSDVEIRERILALPGFQENGTFVGEQRYRQILQFQNPPLTTTDFEASLRRALQIEKLRTALTAWMSVNDQDVADEFRKRNEKIKLDVVPVTAAAFKSQVNVTDAELVPYFEKAKDKYRIGEKRKIKYALLNVDQVRQTITVPEADINAFYQQNLPQYQTPAQVRASHILFKLEGKDEKAVQALAEDVLKKAKAPGADFAALAKQYSEDDSNNTNGGDLDYFGRGRMVAEFDAAAFAMKTGEISNLVKTAFGFHIIKVTDSKPDTTRALADVRAEIEDQLKWQKAQAEAERIAKAIEATTKTPADLEKAAKERGLTVAETGLFLPDEPIGALGPQPEMAQRVFATKEGEVTPALRVAAGWAFAMVTGRQDAYVPKLEEVTAKVRDDVAAEKAAELAKTRAAAIAADLKAAKDFATAAKKAGLEVKTTELIARGAAIPDLGISEAIDQAAFALPVGGVSDAISTPTGTAIVRVAEKVDVTDAEIAAGRDQLRDELVNQRRDRFFGAYMQKAKQGLKINIRQDTLARIVGGV